MITDQVSAIYSKAMSSADYRSGIDALSELIHADIATVLALQYRAHLHQDGTIMLK